MNTQKQTVLVTGASSGIGRSVSETLARRGHNVFATMRQVSGKNAVAAQELQVVEMDTTDDASVAAAVQAVLDSAGAIDVLVNNAGIMTIGVSEALSAAQVAQMCEVNVVGTFRVTQAVLPHMRKRGSGYLVYISSTSSLVVYPFMSMYGATKAAFSALAEALHYEVYSLGIDTTILQCGSYATALPNNVIVGERPNVVETYGLPGVIGNALVGNFAAAMAPGAAGDPRQVGELIADLVARPSGQRPLHQPVGPSSEPLIPLNEAHQAMQGQVLAAFRMEALVKRPEAV
jgi:short-subunit dehydrogenase